MIRNREPGDDHSLEIHMRLPRGLDISQTVMLLVDLELEAEMH